MNIGRSSSSLLFACWLSPLHVAVAFRAVPQGTISVGGNICTVAEEGAECKSTYGVPLGNYEAPCCDESKGFECVYSWKGQFCSLQRGWYPPTWVNKLSIEAMPPLPSGAIPYWQLADANIIHSGGIDVHYGSSMSEQSLGSHRDWFAFVDVWWSALARDTEAARNPAQAIKLYAGGSAAKATRFADVNGLMAGRRPSKADDSQWQFSVDELGGVPHTREVLQYAVELADSLNAIGITEPADGRKLWRGGWYSQDDMKWFRMCLDHGWPLSHPIFMSTSLDEDHAKEFMHPMYCSACLEANEGACTVCPDLDSQVPVLFSITSKHGKELKDLAGNLWEREFIFLPHIPLRVVSVQELKNEPDPEVQDDWQGYPLKGRPGKRGGYLVNQHPFYYLVELADIDGTYDEAFKTLQELRNTYGLLSTNVDSA